MGIHAGGRSVAMQHAIYRAPAEVYTISAMRFSPRAFGTPITPRQRRRQPVGAPFLTSEDEGASFILRLVVMPLPRRCRRRYWRRRRAYFRHISGLLEQRAKI